MLNDRVNERRAAWIDNQVSETGIDEAMIERLVHAFYGRVREDDLLGPVFAAKIEDWTPHLRTMCDFWSGVALMSGRYKGRPMPKHFALPIGEEHFARWLALFEETARAVCPPAAAAFFTDRAHRIAESLQLGIAHASGKLGIDLRRAG